MKTLEEYCLSTKTGFVLENPKKELPEPYSQWTCALDKLTSLLQTNELRAMLAELPQLSIDDLQSHEEQRLGHLVLSLLASAYVWHLGEENASKFLPSSIAVPLLNLSEKLGLKPILCHSDLALANCLFTESAIEKKQFDLSDVTVLKQIGNDKNWKAFFGITALVELAFAPCIEAVMDIQQSIENKTTDGILQHLQLIQKSLENMKKTMELFHDYLDPEVFYKEIRPYLSGWAQDSRVHPVGLFYQTSENQGIEQFCIGGSAAQSCPFQVLDILFGIEHPGERGKFLCEMQNYMIREHRLFLDDLKKQVNLSKFINENGDEKLEQEFNLCKNELTKFRSYHIQIVTKFIVCMASKTKSKFDSLKDKGTGGQDLIPFLKSIRDDL